MRHGGKKESVMKNTVKRLPVTLAIPFLKEVCCLRHTCSRLNLFVVGTSHFYFIFIPACAKNGSYSLEVSASSNSLVTVC